MSKMLLASRSLFGTMRVAQVPVFISFLAVIIFAVPNQTLEVYAAIAQDIAYAGGFQAALNDPFCAKAIAKAALGLMAVILLCVALFAATRRLCRLFTVPPVRAEGGGRVGFVPLAWLIGTLPLAAVGLGIKGAAELAPSERFGAGLRNQFGDLKLAQAEIDAMVTNIQSVQPELWRISIALVWASVVAAGLLWLWDRRSGRDAIGQWGGGGLALAALVLFFATTGATILLPIAIWDWIGALCVIGLFLTILTIAARSCPWSRNELVFPRLPR